MTGTASEAVAELERHFFNAVKRAEDAEGEVVKLRVAAIAARVAIQGRNALELQALRLIHAALPEEKKMHDWKNEGQEMAELQKEKERRVYYQDIVYNVCRTIDRSGRMMLGDGEKQSPVVCGTIEDPSTQVQQEIEVLANAYHALRRRVDDAEQEAEVEPAAALAGKGRHGQE